MKSIIFASLFLATAAMANDIKFDKASNTAIISGARTGTAAELYSIIAQSESRGQVTERGDKVYTKSGSRMGKTKIESKHINASKLSGISTSYSIKIVGAKKDEIKLVNSKTLTLKGKAADQLMGSLDMTHSFPDILPVGNFTIDHNGQIICSHPVVQNPVNTCTIKIK